MQSPLVVKAADSSAVIDTHAHQHQSSPQPCTHHVEGDDTRSVSFNTGPLKGLHCNSNKKASLP